MVNSHTLLQKEIPKPESGKVSSEISSSELKSQLAILHHCFFSFFLLSVLLLVDVETAGRLIG